MTNGTELHCFLLPLRIVMSPVTMKQAAMSSMLNTSRHKYESCLYNDIEADPSFKQEFVSVAH